jgi:hypothetical protein
MNGGQLRRSTAGSLSCRDEVFEAPVVNKAGLTLFRARISKNTHPASNNSSEFYL